jgi:hypothetical protein
MVVSPLCLRSTLTAAAQRRDSASDAERRKEKK